MKSLAILIFSLYASSLLAADFPNVDPATIWQGVIQLQDDTLTKYQLNDLPGTICMLLPNQNGKLNAYLIGNKVLKTGNELPKVNAVATPLVSAEVSGDVAANISYIALLSASYGRSNDIKFTATETANVAVTDNQIDWTAFSNRVASLKSKATNAVFGVVKIASVLTITHQAFRSVSSAGKITGWGFSGDGKYLSESSQLSTTYIVGVDLAYLDSDLPEYSTTSSSEIKSLLSDPATRAKIKPDLENALSVGLKQRIEGRAVAITDVESLK